jgi:hypothetical protein
MSSNYKMKKNMMLTSPKTYLKKYIYETVIKCKKRKKIPTEEFDIPDYTEYDKLNKLNYNVKQLKSICRFYKQKVTGNKGQLVFLLYNYLKYSNYAIIIQKYFRGFLKRKLDKLRGIKQIKNCVNETDFFTLENINKLDKSQIYIFRDTDGFIYGFDICSLYNMIFIEKQTKNPYNRRKLPVHKILNDMKLIIKIGKIHNENPNIVLDNNMDELSKDKKLELRAIGIFQKIDDMGFITDVKWYLNLERTQLKKFLKELLDIWQYRSQISNDTKYKIHPLHGNPFFGFNVSILSHKCKEVLQCRLLDLIEILITSGVDADAKHLGTLYVLGALTIVNHNAASSLPWLYESFAIIN